MNCSYLEPMPRNNQLRVNNYYGVRHPYYVYKQPKYGLSSEEELEIVRGFKNLSDPRSIGLIADAYEGFEQALNSKGWPYGVSCIQDFDVVMKLPSSYPANDASLQFLKEFLRHDTIVIEDGFNKLNSECVNFDKDRMLSEPSGLKNLEWAEKHMDDFYNAHFGEPFEIKKIKTKLRRYVYGFMELNHTNLGSIIRNKRVLLIDDTVAEGITFREAQNLIDRFRPRSIIGFAHMRDYRKHA